MRGDACMFMPQHHIRRFSFKPYYYDPEAEETDEKHRIKFRRLRKSPKPEKKPVRRWLILAIGIFFLIWYLQKVQEPPKLEIQDIRIEDISPVEVQ